jgi:hypothetical protein
VGSLAVLSIGFSFAADNNIYCEYTEWQDWIHSGSNNIGFICSQNNLLADVSELQVKNIKKDDYWVLWSIYYNNQLLRTNESFNSMSLLKLMIDKPNKNIFLYNWFGDVCDVHTKVEKLWFNGISYYTISYRWSLNPIITLETSKYTTTIYFSDNTKNYIKEPTSKNKYTGLYMKKVSKDTKKVTLRTLYSFSPISFKDSCGWDNNIFNISPSVWKQFGLNWKYYVFQTNTRKIQLDLTNTWKSIITKIK